MKESLANLTARTKDVILEQLKSGQPMSDKNLMPLVLSIINLIEKRNGDLEHRTETVHIIAYIKAYKELEANGQLKITRSVGVPAPMTDYETLYQLQRPQSPSF